MGRKPAYSAYFRGILLHTRGRTSRMRVFCIKNEGFLDESVQSGYPMGAVPVKLNPVFGSPLFVVKAGPR